MNTPVYPAYISINQSNDRAANGERCSMDIVITVRSKADAGREGTHANIQLNRSTCKRLVLDLLRELLKG